ncbi:hypothetical protein EDD22DRAFT_952371 [Suillus occidentalis]|nr:hypothetical protein EDD22DRAFT_952371 [Suillus occidentalis]
MNSSKSTLQNSSSSRLGQKPDQDSMRLVLQLGLEHLDEFDRYVHDEIQEMRSRFIDLLDSCQSDVTMGNSGGCDSTVDSKTELDELNLVPPFVYSHDRCFMPHPVSHKILSGITGSLSEGTGPSQSNSAVCAGLLPSSSAEYGPTAQPSLTRPQHSMYPKTLSAFRDPHVPEPLSEGANRQPLQDLSVRGTADSVYEPEPTVQASQGIYFEEYAPSSSSARPDEQLSGPVAQVRQIKDKIKCPRYGCSAFVKKNGLTRHINEVHEGKIKVVCAGCGRAFKRPYQLHGHILRSRCGRF